MRRTRALRRLANQKGFTLTEMVSVLAITAILAAILLPIAVGVVTDAPNTTADADFQALAATLTQFFNDLRHFPACDGSVCDPIKGAGTGDNNNLKFLATGVGSGDLSGTYGAAFVGSTSWNLTANDDPTTPAKNNAFNHLVVNNPNADLVVAEAGKDYSTSGPRKWKGSYMAALKADPWGNPYIIHVGGMEKDGVAIGGATAKGWILSAGPNGVLETNPTDSQLCGGASPCDDRGFIFFTKD